MKPRIAIPIPNSTELDYNKRAWPAYAQAIEHAGGEPVEIPLTATQQEIANILNTCQGVLLPGSPADTNPQKYGAEREPECGPSDAIRESVDELLFQDAYNLHKPILGICYGAQSLNVWRTGTLVQHLLPMPVNHPAGKAVPIAHTAMITPDSLLGSIIAEAKSSDTSDAPEAPLEGGFLKLPVNSSHHQAIGIAGDGLRVVARCPQDGVVEAVEGTAPDHFVLGIQWHPERSQGISAASRAIFDRFVHEAASWQPRKISESIG
ncbi:MAG: gamma-glutamyl-gamma-aminobutyrate hydrolase family protein [Acidobacteriaceae bacterium]|nr:gamma-glutamyl-gamma-aminobutyrate hydrolase family protein [Acidobacteriaceae bacterium]